MNKLIPEALELAGELKEKLAPPLSADVVLAPPFTALSAVKNLLSGAPIELAGQNICCEPSGAYTGEISAPMLKDAGCTFVIIGHSERRQLFGEDDPLINKKIKTALAHGLKVIFCLGETLEMRENNQTTQVVRRQLEKGLEGLENLQNLVIAYEPIWAIGTGKVATPQQAQEVHHFIRGHLARLSGKEASAEVRLLYGGSVKPETSVSLLAQEDIDGLLVGGASLIAESFYAIINAVN